MARDSTNPVPTRDLIGLRQSAAMLTTGTKVSVPREEFVAIVDELLENRGLLARLGADLKTVARRSP